MKLPLIIGAACAVVYPVKDYNHLVKRGACQSSSGCIQHANSYVIPGYRIGTSFLKKLDVFTCINVKKRQSYVCKIQKVEDPKDKPMEAKVYELIRKHPHPSLPTMHELIDLGFVDGERTYVEVLEYYKPSQGWMNLHDYITKHHIPKLWKYSLIDAVEIFRQIVDGIVHLFNHGVSHSDLKRNHYIY
jgi:serine/threonine protein kinase